MPGPRPPAAVWGEGECTPPRPGPRELNPPAAPHLPVLSERVASPTPPHPETRPTWETWWGSLTGPASLPRTPSGHCRAPQSLGGLPTPLSCPSQSVLRAERRPAPPAPRPSPGIPSPGRHPGLSEAERSEGGLSEPRPSPHSRGRLGGSCPDGGRVALCAGSLPRPPPRGAPGPVLRPGVPSPETS